MSGRLARLIAKYLPFDVRYSVVMAEFVRTPKGDYNSMGTSVESVLRNMKMNEMAKKQRSFDEENADQERGAGTHLV